MTDTKKPLFNGAKMRRIKDILLDAMAIAFLLFCLFSLAAGD